MLLFVQNVGTTPKLTHLGAQKLYYGISLKLYWFIFLETKTLICNSINIIEIENH